jgi:hypothetical protein
MHWSKIEEFTTIMRQLGCLRWKYNEAYRLETDHGKDACWSKLVPDAKNYGVTCVLIENRRIHEFLYYSMDNQDSNSEKLVEVKHSHDFHLAFKTTKTGRASRFGYGDTECESLCSKSLIQIYANILTF